MSRRKIITTLFVVFLFSYLFYLTSCLREVEEPTATQEAVSPSTDAVESTVPGATATSVAAPPEATEQIIRLALNPAREAHFPIFRPKILWDPASAPPAISG